ncbi:hypothetical protein [Neorhodopirellula lusitana]
MSKLKKRLKLGVGHFAADFGDQYLSQVSRLKMEVVHFRRI